jgi:hypothetical protein
LNADIFMISNFYALTARLHGRGHHESVTASGEQWTERGNEMKTAPIMRNTSKQCGLLSWWLAFAVSAACGAADNTLTQAEKEAGWILLFDGKTTSGWMNSDRSAPRTDVQDGALNPHKAGHYMLVHTQQWENFVLALDFKISPRCNSGIFVRTSSLTPRPGKDVGFNGIEIAIDDTTRAGFHDTGAVYDLVKPSKNAMKPAGEWNHIEITSDRNRIEVVLNGERVTSADLGEFKEAYKRPDGSAHKFDVAFKDRPQRGYIGLQDHGSPCWFKNIKVKPFR